MNRRGGATLAVFVVASVALLVVPGPAVLYIVAQSIDGGRRAGLRVDARDPDGWCSCTWAAATVGLSAVDRLVGRCLQRRPLHSAPPT